MSPWGDIPMKQLGVTFLFSSGTGAKYCGHCASPMRTLLMPESEVTAVILAAGVARRLAPLTAHTQKPLLPVGRGAILAWMPEATPAVGVRQVAAGSGSFADPLL